MQAPAQDPRHPSHKGTRAHTHTVTQILTQTLTHDIKLTTQQSRVLGADTNTLRTLRIVETRPHAKRERQVCVHTAVPPRTRLRPPLPLNRPRARGAHAPFCSQTPCSTQTAGRQTARRRMREQGQRASLHPYPARREAAHAADPPPAESRRAPMAHSGPRPPCRTKQQRRGRARAEGPPGSTAARSSYWEACPAAYHTHIRAHGQRGGGARTPHIPIGGIPTMGALGGGGIARGVTTAPPLHSPVAAAHVSEASDRARWRTPKVSWPHRPPTYAHPRRRHRRRHL